MLRQLPRPTLGILLCLLSVASADACKYNVRDVAFVDLGEQPYRIFIISKGGEGAALAAAVTEASSAVLADTNVDAQLIDLDQSPDHPAAEYAISAGATTYPAAVLVSPDDRALLLPWEITAKTTAQQLAPRMTEVVQSPRRSEILGKVLDVHSVIIVVDGRDESLNGEILELVENTIPIVEGSLASLPKPIKEPPHLIHLTQDEAQIESILLWSLGVEVSETSPTQMALVFGRGRQLGPVLRFPEDKRRQFLHSLAVVGQDCECGLDRRWMQGQMVPHVWSSDDEAIALKKLNFDPGNALVKAEIDRIISRGPGSQPGGRGGLEQDDVMFPALSYQEIALDDEPEEKQPETNDESEPVAGHRGDEAPAGDEPQDDAQGVRSTSVAKDDPAPSPADSEIDIDVDIPADLEVESEKPDGVLWLASQPNYTLIGLLGLAACIVVVGLTIMLRGSGA